MHDNPEAVAELIDTLHLLAGALDHRRQAIEGGQLAPDEAQSQQQIDGLEKLGMAIGAVLDGIHELRGTLLLRREAIARAGAQLPA
ncbi:hypothetical protein [Fontivita pretiosa]|uniref:hypothetical protein n=1 Tax=Fontivita pretiosa TaxID=2989684 RepID=UPI003D181B22